MKVLGIITARGGSKGIPGKNIKPLSGKPLIAYTIEAAQKSGVLDRIILSTDDSAIAAVARQYGCEVPFMRPADLAGDTAVHLPVLQHAVSFLKEKEGYAPDCVFLLQPTSPLRQSHHIKEAVELIQSSGADSVLSVAEIPDHYHPLKAMILDQRGGLVLINGNPVRKRIARRQDLPKAYWSVGSIYLFKTELLFDQNEPNFYGDHVVPYVIDEKYVIDLNTMKDWEEAECALKLLSHESLRH